MAYVGDSGKRVAPTRRSRPARKPPAPPARHVEPPHGDIASSGGDYGTRRAKGYTAKAAFRESVRKAYKAQPLPQRKAVSHAAAHRPGPAAAAISHEHKSRIARNREFARGQAQHDVPGADLGRANRYLAAHPYILNPKNAPTTQKPSGLQTGGPNLPFSAGKLVRNASGVLGGLLSVADVVGQAAQTTDVPAVKTGGKVLENFAKETIDIPSGAVPSTIHSGVDIAKATKEGGPVAGAKLAGEQAIQFPLELYHHPGRTFVNKPLSTLLTVQPIFRTPGALLGRGMRALPGPTRRAASTAGRASEVRPGTSLENTRTYAGNPITKAFQVKREKGKGDKPVIMKDPEVRERVDEFFSAHEHLRRRAVADARKVTHETVGKKNTPGQVLAAQNVIKPTRESLAAERHRLVAKQKDLSHDEMLLAQNKATVAAIDDELKNFDPKKYDNLEGYKAYSHAQQTKLGVLYGQSSRIDHANLRPYAVKWMGGHEENGKFVDSDGAELTTDRIRAHMATDEGPGVVTNPAFVSHAPGRSEGSAFYQPVGKPAKIGPAGRSGKAIDLGVADVSEGVLEENAARSASLTATATSFSRFLDEFGYKQADKLVQVGSYRDAADVARRWNFKHPDQQVAPIRTNPFGAGAEQLHALMDQVNDGSMTAEEASSSIESALKGEGGDQGPWSLVPAAARDQAIDHMATQTRTVFQNVANIYGGMFRKTVLALSPKWMTGNVVEAALRLVIADNPLNLPANFYRGYKSLRGLTGVEKEEALARMVGGGHGELMQRVPVYSNAERFAGTKLAKFANAMAKLRGAPGARNLANTWNRYTDFVFHSLNGNFESFIQHGMLGKALKDSPLMEEHTFKLSKAAIEDAAKGLRNTNNQVAFGRQVDRMFGKYSKFSPGTRRLISTYTPFIAWAFNAIKFITSVLPRDHPVITALGVSVVQANDEWRKEHKLGWFIDGHVPDFLISSYPLGNGNSIRLGRYTPLGIAEDPLGTIGSQFAPQYSNIVNALQGKDWKGDDLPGKGTGHELQVRGLAAATALIEASVPITGQLARLLTEPSKDNPTGMGFQHGPIADRLNKEFNPFAQTQAKKSTKSGKSKTNYFGGSSSGNDRYKIKKPSTNYFGVSDKYRIK